MVGALIFLGFSAAMLIFVFAVATSKDKPEKHDWIDTVYRPCCRHCAYWIPDPGMEPGYKTAQFCDKLECYTDWDYCCMNYDGIETEVGYGTRSDGV